MSNRRYNTQNRTKLRVGGSSKAMQKLQQLLQGQSKKKKSPRVNLLMAAMKRKK